MVKVAVLTALRLPAASAAVTVRGGRLGCALVPEGAEVCLIHPGGDIDLNIRSDVRTLTHIWMGNITWASALRTHSLKVTGPSDLRRALPRWLKLNPFAPIPPVAR